MRIFEISTKPLHTIYVKENDKEMQSQVASPAKQVKGTRNFLSTNANQEKDLFLYTNATEFTYSSSVVINYETKR